MKSKHHLLYHYLSLVLILLVGIILIFLSQGFPSRQIQFTYLLAFLYVVWGIIHHRLKGDLHLRIVIEYALIALLSVFILRAALMH